jgi:nucleotide-binding universal stress UspA family protein
LRQTRKSFGIGPDVWSVARGQTDTMTEGQRIILVGTNGSAPSAAATQFAVELAAACGDRLVFVTAWRELRGSWGIPLHHFVPELTEIERDWAASHSAAAADAAAAAGVPAEAVIRHGDAADVICDVAEEVKPRLIVVGSHRWSAVERVFAGSVADRVTHQAPCPVLVVPEAATPEGAASASSLVSAHR